MSVKAIPNRYVNAENKDIINKIRAEREKVKTGDGFLPEFWLCGSAVCEMSDTGYYYCWCPEKDPFYGRIMRKWRVNCHGELVYTKNFYKVATKQDLIMWCADRGITLE